MRLSVWRDGDDVVRTFPLWRAPFPLWRALRQIRGLGLGRELTVGRLVESLERELGREIRFTTAPIGSRFSAGYTVHTDTQVWVVCDDASPSEAHRWQVWLHELAHLVCGHQREEPLQQLDLLQSLFPDVPAELLRDTFTRRCVADGSLSPTQRRRHRAAEIEAETLSALLLRRVSSWAGEHSQLVSPEQAAAELMRRTLG